MNDSKTTTPFRLPNGLTLSENRLLAMVNACFGLVLLPTRKNLDDARTLKAQKLARVKMVNRGGAVYLELSPLTFPRWE